MVNTLFWFSPILGFMRFADVPEGTTPDDYPPYRASGMVVLVDNLAILLGFSGRMKKGDVFNVYRELRSRGATCALAKRRQGHTIPFADYFSHPLIGDWFIVDLLNFDKRGE